MKLKKALNTGQQIIPVGAELHFSNEGIGYYNGEEINIYKIPTHAIEKEDIVLINNQLNPENKWKAFDALVPGDQGYNANGEPITIFGKAIGAGGYDALVTQFGNTSKLTFEELTAGKDKTEIEATQFVAYSDKDGSVFVDEYSNDTVAVTAVESDGSMKTFDDVEANDFGVTKDGKVVTIIGKGQGKVWFDKTCKEQELECDFAPFKKMLAEGESTDTLNFVLCNIKDKPNFIDVYGTAGVRVIDESMSGTEALALIAKLS